MSGEFRGKCPLKYCKYLMEFYCEFTVAGRTVAAVIFWHTKLAATLCKKFPLEIQRFFFMESQCSVPCWLPTYRPLSSRAHSSPAPCVTARLWELFSTLPELSARKAAYGGLISAAIASLVTGSSKPLHASCPSLPHSRNICRQRDKDLNTVW